MICQRAEQHEALGAGCVCVCMMSVSVELITCVPRHVLSVFVLMCLLGTHTEPHCQLALGPGTCSSLASTGPLDLSGCDSDLFTWACSQVGANHSLYQDYPIVWAKGLKERKCSFFMSLSLQTPSQSWLHDDTQPNPPFPAPRHIHLATLLGSATPELAKLLPMASNCSETSHGCDSWAECLSINLSPQWAQPGGCVETSPLQKLCHKGGSWHKACVGQLNRLKCEHISSTEVLSVMDKSTSRDEAFKALGTQRI